MATKKASKKTKKAVPVKDDNTKVFSILTYLIFIVGLIWYLVDENIQKSKSAKFHFKQSLVLVIAYFILQIVASIISLGVLNTLVWIAFLVLVVLGIINAANGVDKELPVIGKFAEKFKF